VLLPPSPKSQRNFNPPVALPASLLNSAAVSASIFVAEEMAIEAGSSVTVGLLSPPPPQALSKRHRLLSPAA
jgi:hypothetical protein